MAAPFVSTKPPSVVEAEEEEAVASAEGEVATLAAEVIQAVVDTPVAVGTIAAEVEEAMADVTKVATGVVEVSPGHLSHLRLITNHSRI